jgi:hypothetical protein
MPGIDLNDAAQLDLLRRAFPAFRAEYARFPRQSTGNDRDFSLDNTWFSGMDAFVLHGMIRHFRPRLVLEVGSGYSTRVALQAATMNGDTRLICVEPYPDDPVRHVLFRGARHDLISLIPEKVEDVGRELFMQLVAGDMLVIDSSHVSRIGGDVNRLVLDVLPRLNPGVIVHFHDIFLPWEYPREWVVEWRRAFSEQYLLQAFLTLNPHFAVIMANHYLSRAHETAVQATFPDTYRLGTTSFWIRREPR